MAETARLQLLLGDITTMKVDAIVNSTDHLFSGDGPVHKAVRRAAGPALDKACGRLESCETGSARITPGYKMKAHCIIHTVAPIWMDGREGEADKLRSCYTSALELAAICGLESIAFPTLGTGKQPQIPMECAAPIAIHAILDHLEKKELPRVVTLVCFDTESFMIHQEVLKKAHHNGPLLFQIKPQENCEIMQPCTIPHSNL